MLSILAATPVNLTNPPTAGGFTAADLLAIIALMIPVGLALLTAIAVLVLRTITAQDRRITEVDTRAAEAIKALRSDLSQDIRDVWGELRRINPPRIDRLPATPELRTANE